MGGPGFSAVVSPLPLSPRWLVRCHPQAPCHALEKLAKINLYLLCIHSILFRETAISLSIAWAWPWQGGGVPGEKGVGSGGLGSLGAAYRLLLQLSLFSFGATASARVRGSAAGEERQRGATPEEGLSATASPPPLLLPKSASHGRFPGVPMLEVKSRWSSAALFFSLGTPGAGRGAVLSPRGLPTGVLESAAGGRLLIS